MESRAGQDNAQISHAGFLVLLNFYLSLSSLAAYIIAQMIFNLTLHAVALDSASSQLRETWFCFVESSVRCKRCKVEKKGQQEAC